MKKQWLFLALSVMLAACGSKSAVEKKGSGSYTNDNGEKTTAKVTLKDDKIASVDIDETAKGKDKTKKQLGDAYGMKEASPIKKEWNDQVTYFEKYVAKHGVDKIRLNKDGQAENNDVRSGCTIRVEGFLKAIDEAKKNAK